MTHTTELKTLDDRMSYNGWEIVLKEQPIFDWYGVVLTDIDRCYRKENFSGMNYLLIEMKGGHSPHIKKAKKQIKFGMKYIVANYNPDRLWGIRAHKQKFTREGVYEK